MFAEADWYRSRSRLARNQTLQCSDRHLTNQKRRSTLHRPNDKRRAYRQLRRDDIGGSVSFLECCDVTQLLTDCSSSPNSNQSGVKPPHSKLLLQAHSLDYIFKARVVAKRFKLSLPADFR